MKLNKGDKLIFKDRDATSYIISRSKTRAECIDENHDMCCKDCFGCVAVEGFSDNPFKGFCIIKEYINVKYMIRPNRKNKLNRILNK